MKKVFAGVVAALVMSGGMVAASGEAAQAACPYTGCVRTYTHVTAKPAKLHRGGHERVCVRVTTGGAARPKGRVTIRVVRSVGHYRYVDSKRYTAPRTCFRTPSLRKPGKYVVAAIFDRRANSPFRDSDNRTAFRVLRHR